MINGFVYGLKRGFVIKYQLIKIIINARVSYYSESVSVLFTLYSLVWSMNQRTEINKSYKHKQFLIISISSTKNSWKREWMTYLIVRHIQGRTVINIWNIFHPGHPYSRRAGEWWEGEWWEGEWWEGEWWELEGGVVGVGVEGWGLMSDFVYSQTRILIYLRKCHQSKNNEIKGTFSRLGVFYWGSKENGSSYILHNTTPRGTACILDNLVLENMLRF